MFRPVKELGDRASASKCRGYFLANLRGGERARLLDPAETYERAADQMAITTKYSSPKDKICPPVIWQKPGFMGQ